MGILLHWREEGTTLVADSMKMFNSIFIEPTEQHCHRFLWRGLKTENEPDTYIIQRVNMGDKPAGATSSEALYKTASLFQQEYPEVADMLKHSTYVDDIVHSVQTPDAAMSLADETDIVLSKAGFKVKSWQFSGETVTQQQVVSEVTGNRTVRVLGVLWKPEEDNTNWIKYQLFCKKKRSICRRGPHR